MAGSSRVALFKSLGVVLEALPERVDVWLGRTIARRVGRRALVARGHLTTNIRHALFSVNATVDEPLLERFLDRGFSGYGQYWAEGAKLPALAKSTIFERFTMSEGLEYLEEARERGKGTVIALPHVGSWEWGGSFLAQLGMPMVAVAEDLDPPALFAWFKQKRESIGIRIEPLDEHAGTILIQTLKDGGVVGLLCDRDLQSNGVEVEFFGERVTMPAGPATLALRTGATLVASACYTGPGRDHFAVVTPPIPAERTGRLRDDVNRVTQSIAYELEGLIRRAPEQWHVLQPIFRES